MPFSLPPKVRVLTNGRSFRTVDEVDYYGKTDRWTIPSGFDTDFATIPALVSWLVPKLGAYTLAAILHDYFCVYGIRRNEISGRDADAVFRRVMREGGVDFITRWMIWTGVRWGALFNPIRRADWHRDAPLVLLLSIPLLPLALLPAVIGRPIILLVTETARLVGLK